MMTTCEQLRRHLYPYTLRHLLEGSCPIGDSCRLARHAMAHVPELTGVCVIRVLSALTGELILEALVDEADLVSTPNFRDDLRRYIQAKTGISSFRQQLLLEDKIIPDACSWESLGRPQEIRVTFQQTTEDFGDELLVAAEMGYTKRVQEILESFQNPDCVSPDEAKESAVFKACKRGHLEVLELLLRAGADLTHPASDGKTPLLIAAEHGQLALVRRLVEAGAHTDLDKETQRGHTPLIMAILNGHLHIIHYLIEARADKEKAFKDNDPPLLLAVDGAPAGGRQEAIRCLLDAGANMERMNSRGMFPLLMAAHEGQVDIVCQLLEAQANVNQTGSDGLTALLAAVAEGHVDVLKCLLKARANPCTPLNNGSTPWSIANSVKYDRRHREIEACVNHTEILQCLRKAGAQEFELVEQS